MLYAQSISNLQTHVTPALRAELQLDPPKWRPTLQRETVMLSSGPLVGDNGLTLPISDVYYIQVHLSFRGSWPRVTPEALQNRTAVRGHITGTATGTAVKPVPAPRGRGSRLFRHLVFVLVVLALFPLEIFVLKRSHLGAATL